MEFLYSDEPIIACSTSAGSNAAMAVLRISGFRSLSEYQNFFSKDLTTVEPRKVYYTNLIYKDQVYDDVCITYFAAPKSYNGENTLEISIHGNTLNIDRILKLFTTHSPTRLAAPGEFTYRALKNKKLTLAQVEGLDLFLNANSGYALNEGLSLLSGSLYDLYKDLYQLFTVHKASLELAIDFAEDVGEETAQEQYLETLNAFAKKFKTLVSRVAPLQHNILEPEITLAGLPNAGKSSLFNFLLRDERAIVSPIAGTTRDYLSESLVINDVRFKLVDTAGLREATDVIEQEGIKRTKRLLNASFFSILLINPFEIVEGFKELLELNFDCIYFTHADQEGFAEARAHLVQIYPQLGPMGAVNLANPDKNFLPSLYDQITKKYLDIISSKPILFDRHRSLIQEIDRLLDNYVNLASYETDVAILSHELNTLGHCLSELIGIISPDQVLNSIFSNFCIGK
ncbi:MAG TPA: GTPase [Bacteriovoracaceae bacterium]|nr:GTPase [Bacteriovoracaceae bacterium]